MATARKQIEQAIELTCAQCGARFVIRPRAARVQGRTVPCMRCEAPIVVPDWDADRGWRRVSHDAIFARFGPSPSSSSATASSPPPRAEPSATPSEASAERSSIPRRGANFRFQPVDDLVEESDASTDERVAAALRAPRSISPHVEDDATGRALDDAVDDLLDMARQMFADDPIEEVEPDAAASDFTDDATAPKPTAAPSEPRRILATRAPSDDAETPAPSETSETSEATSALVRASLDGATSPGGEAIDALFERSYIKRVAPEPSGEHDTLRLPPTIAPTSEKKPQREAKGEGAESILDPHLLGELFPEDEQSEDESVEHKDSDASADEPFDGDEPIEESALPPSLPEASDAVEALEEQRVPEDDGALEDEDEGRDKEEDVAEDLGDVIDGADSADSAEVVDAVEDLSEAFEELIVPEEAPPTPALPTPPTLPAPPPRQPEPPSSHADASPQDGEAASGLLPPPSTPSPQDGEGPLHASELLAQASPQDAEATPQGEDASAAVAEAPVEPILADDEDDDEPVVELVDVVSSPPELPDDASEVQREPAAEGAVVPPPLMEASDAPSAAGERVPADAPDDEAHPDEDLATPDAPVAVPAPFSRIWAFVLVGLGVALLGVSAIALFGEDLRETEERVEVVGPTPPPVTHTVEVGPNQVARAIDTTSMVVRLAARQDWRAVARQEDVAEEFLGASAPERAEPILAYLWTAHVLQRDARMAHLYARALHALGQYEKSREVAITGLVKAPDHAQLTEVFNAAVADDPALHPEVLTLEADKQIDEIRALGGGKSISLKLRRGGATTHAFKPAQREWSEGWRAEVASYLLCEAITCNFDVPRSLPARISRADFEALYGRHTSTKQTEYAARFDQLEWVQERGPDGTEREYLYGVIKDWVPGFIDYPIEYVDIWRPFLDPTGDPSLYDKGFRRAFWALRNKQQGKYWWPLMTERKEATPRTFARGISSILVFDFLTSNWDRFSSVESYYGVNNQFDDGRFLSLDNGAAFHVLTQQKVVENFEPVGRFSHRLIAAARHMKPASFNDVFFPNPSAEATDRLATFWTQRETLIGRVDALIDKHGAEAVLFFE